MLWLGAVVGAADAQSPAGNSIPQRTTLFGEGVTCSVLLAADAGSGGSLGCQRRKMAYCSGYSPPQLAPWKSRAAVVQRGGRPEGHGARHLL